MDWLGWRRIHQISGLPDTRMHRLEAESRLYLWDQRSIFVGRIDEELVLCPASSTLIIAIDDYIEIFDEAKGRFVACYTVLFPPCRKTRVNFRNAKIINLYLDVLGRDQAGLERILSSQGDEFFYNADKSCSKLRWLVDLIVENKSVEEVMEMTNHALADLQPEATPVDARVNAIIELINVSYENNILVDDLARHVNLSVPQTYKVFKAQTGMPIRKYRTWRRLFMVAKLVGNGESLTEAALSVGFSDSSHFIHSFKDVYSIPPSFFINRSKSLSIYSPTTN